MAHRREDGPAAGDGPAGAIATIDGCCLSVRSEPPDPLQARSKIGDGTGQVGQLLLQHAATCSRLATSVEQLETDLLEFATTREAIPLLERTIGFAREIDQLRGRLLDDCLRSWSAVREFDPAQRRINVNVRSQQTAVVLPDGLSRGGRG